ncbi:MAG: YbgC/FadM family acyl-CoA thioesterase [Helicobacteraceae bacterium]|jgi:acyl-CoA thioester hydrolase|nr:YbgC/FadM family acyl-CoA thioesterase [Helicobacteraceae bacterium]
MKLRVYYEDTDSLGMVYHANYLKFIERARSEAFFALAKSPEGANFYFVVRSMNLKFARSAKLGDLLETRSRLIEMRSASFSLAQEIFLGETLIFSAIVELAHIKNGKPAAIAPETKERLSAVFGE